jgi:hypothetical protein
MFFGISTGRVLTLAGVSAATAGDALEFAKL